jgi:hypothetical protein
MSWSIVTSHTFTAKQKGPKSPSSLSLSLSSLLLFDPLTHRIEPASKASYPIKTTPISHALIFILQHPPTFLPPFSFSHLIQIHIYPKEIFQLLHPILNPQLTLGVQSFLKHVFDFLLRYRLSSYNP